MPRMSRRGLIELGIGAGAAAATASAAHASAPHGPPLPDGQKLGFAIVGIGKLSQGQLIPGLRKAYGVKLSSLRARLSQAACFGSAFSGPAFSRPSGDQAAA